MCDNCIRILSVSDIFLEGETITESMSWRPIFAGIVDWDVCFQISKTFTNTIELLFKDLFNFIVKLLSQPIVLKSSYYISYTYHY